MVRLFWHSYGSFRDLKLSPKIKCRQILALTCCVLLLKQRELMERAMLKVGMGTNTENGIRIFGTSIRIYSNIQFGRSCLCWFGRSFLFPGSEHIRILVTLKYTINLRCRKFNLEIIYRLFRIRLLVYVKLFLDYL